jgi:hypothetical protein
MDLDSSEEQELLRATARDVLGRLSSIARARAVMAGDRAQAAELWDALARLVAIEGVEQLLRARPRGSGSPRACASLAASRTGR